MLRGTIRESFSLNLSVMRSFGLYPPKKYKRLYQVKAYLIYLIFILPIPLFGCLYLFLEEDIDLVRVSENVFLLAEMGCYIVKYLPFLKNGQKIKNCVLYFESLSVSDDQLKIIDNCRKICKRNTKIFLCSVTGGVSSWAAKPLLLKTGRLPIDVWLPFTYSSNSTIYYAIYIYLVTAVASAAYMSGAVDPLVAGLACHATGQLKVLKDNLQRLSDTPDVYDQIKKCTDHHSSILKFVKEYEDCFSLVVFSQFVGSVIVICVSCFELTMMDPLSFDFFAMSMYLITMLAEIYLFCYYGTTLYDESNSLANAIYMGNWYDYDEKSKKALSVIMERSKQPITVTAGKVLDLSLVTFTTILRRSYSLLAVLNNYK